MCLIPILEGPNASGSMLVYHNDKKGAPLGKEKRVQETDGPVYSLVKQFQKGLAAYFWSQYLKDKCKLHPRCLEKWMSCFEGQDCVGWEQTEWDHTTGKVTNKFLTRETLYTDAVDREFATMGIENWRNHSTLVAGKEAVDAEQDKELLMKTKVAAAATSDKHVDDNSADKNICAASIIRCMSSYASIFSNAKATAGQELRKAFTTARVQQANTYAALQKLQYDMEAGNEQGRKPSW